MAASKMACKLPLILLVSLLVACIITFAAVLTHCYGVMSVDLGSEWMKVGLVAPNVPMDLVLNDQSNRKTAMAIAISNGERSLGDPALDVAIKHPERTFTHFLDLVGKSIDDESVKRYKQKFPYADISSHKPNSSSIVLNHPEGTNFTPLELVAMMLQLARDQATNRAGTNELISDVVITVPPFFNSVEKKVIADAARLVGLNVLKITQSNSAFALSYGIFRHKDYLPENSDNKTSIIFFDQGASQTSVTVADYHMIEQVDPVTFASKNESLPTVTIRAQVYDRFLGGFDMQMRLRDHLIAAFCEETKIDPERIYKRGRSSSKVLKEAGRVKKVLSANSNFMVRIENVIDDKDLRLHITRKDYENMNEDLLTTRTIKLLDKLFELPEVSQDERFESVIIVGGNTRTPKIQQVLQDYFKLGALGKTVNADEGAALASLYQAASLGRGFRVKKFALEEFGEERVRYDPAKVIVATETTPSPATTEATSSEEPTTTGAPSNETASSSSETPVEVGTTTETSEASQANTTEARAPTTQTLAVAIPRHMPDPEAIYSQAELERIGQKLAAMRADDFSRLQKLLELNKLELEEIENERKLSEKGASGEDSSGAEQKEELPQQQQQQESTGTTSESAAGAEEKPRDEEIKRSEL